jgi:putative glutamine amidotransferase
MQNKQRKIYVIGGTSHYANWMQGTQFVHNAKDADLVVLTGGADINPKLYSRDKHPTTCFIESRDTYEVAETNLAMDLDKPIVGICRGAQLLCALAGGMLIQDQDDPHYFHEMMTSDHRKITMTSMHHQAMYPWQMKPLAYKVLAWTINNSSHHEGSTRGHEMIYTAPPCLNREVEICYFPDINALGIQGHPEMMFRKTDLELDYGPKDKKPITESIDYCRNLVNKLIANEL